MSTAKLLAGMLSLTILVGVMSNAFGQAIYKWVDGQGVTHFGELPPQGVLAERTTVRLRSTNRPALQARIDSAANRNTAIETRKQHEGEQTAEEEAQANRNQLIRAENCDTAKARLSTYNTSHRLYRILEDGERVYLSDSELDNERAQAQEDVDAWCH